MLTLFNLSEVVVYGGVYAPRCAPLRGRLHGVKDILHLRCNCISDAKRHRKFQFCIMNYAFQKSVESVGGVYPSGSASHLPWGGFSKRSCELGGGFCKRSCELGEDLVNAHAN